MPPGDGPVTSTPRGDATALGVIGLAMLLGRRVAAPEFPDRLPDLVAEARERHGEDDHPLSGVFARWLRRALQLDEDGFDSPHAAQIAFEEVLASNRRYVTGTGALETWVDSHAAAVPLPAFAQPAAPESVQATEGARLDESGADDSSPDPLHVAPAPPRLLGMRPRWAAVVLGVLLLQASVIGWYWSRPAPGPAEGEGELVVTSRPSSARVMVDGSERGSTPLTVTLSAGPHVVEVRSGTSEPRVIPLVIRANVQTAQYVELQEAVPVPPPVERRAPKRRK
jgi:hypothetical protein